MSRRPQSKAGFTLIELVMVVLIITILTGIAVPYYGDYIRDARRSTLKQNLANFRKVLNDFRGDQGRGPFRVPVYNNGTAIVSNPRSALDFELIAGPIQVTRSGSAYEVVRRTGFKYLPAFPILEDPESASRIDWNYGTSTLFFVDDGLAEEANRFDFNKDFAFIDNNANASFDGEATDTVQFLFNGKSSSDYIGSTAKPLDFISLTATDSTGMNY